LSAYKWSELVKCLKSIGFKGPFVEKGKKHPYFMTRGTVKLHIPNKHKDSITEPLLTLLREQGSVAKEECA